MAELATYFTYDGADFGRAPSCYLVLQSTWQRQGARLERTDPAALQGGNVSPDPGQTHDHIDRHAGDLWPQKPRTDVLVRGAARTPDEVPRSDMLVRVRVGDHDRRIEVYGDRPIERKGDGSPRIGAIEPFVTVPIDAGSAYGGVDDRAPYREELEALAGRDKARPRAIIRALIAAGAAYPRNPWGRGYIAATGVPKGAMMPNLEDPDDRLTEDRLTADPKRWWEQPLPAFLATDPGFAFPRTALLWGAPHGLSLGDLSEVKRGFFSVEAFDHQPHPLWLQDAPLGMALEALAPDTPVEVAGMDHGRPAMMFRTPAAPRVEIRFRGEAEEVAVRMTAMHVDPADGRVSFTYVAVRDALSKRYLEGVHPEIPLEATIDGVQRVVYQAPPVHVGPDFNPWTQGVSSR